MLHCLARTYCWGWGGCCPLHQEGVSPHPPHSPALAHAFLAWGGGAAIAFPSWYPGCSFFHLYTAS